jgi:hypothetical protein
MGTIAVGLAFAAVLGPIVHGLARSFLGAGYGPGLLALAMVALPRRTGLTGVAGTPDRAGATAHSGRTGHF